MDPRFGRYRILEPLARSRKSDVYRAVLTGAVGEERLLILKCIQPSFAGETEAFLAEARLLMSMNHPGIVRLFDCGVEGGVPYFAMEHLEGRNLRQIQAVLDARKQVLPVGLACRIIEQVALALHYAHGLRDTVTQRHFEIVHRDVNPENIILTFDGFPKIVDFSMARSNAGETEETTASNVVKGSLTYLSPEQVRGERLDWRADVFSLGMVMWEALTGRRLFEPREMIEAMNSFDLYKAKLVAPSTANADVPPELDEVVMRCLQIKREKRYYDAAEFAGAVRSASHKLGMLVDPASVAPFVRELFLAEIEAEQLRIHEMIRGPQAASADVKDDAGTATDVSLPDGVARESATIVTRLDVDRASGQEKGWLLAEGDKFKAPLEDVARPAHSGHTKQLVLVPVAPEKLEEQAYPLPSRAPRPAPAAAPEPRPAFKSPDPRSIYDLHPGKPAAAPASEPVAPRPAREPAPRPAAREASASVSSRNQAEQSPAVRWLAIAAGLVALGYIWMSSGPKHDPYKEQPPMAFGNGSANGGAARVPSGDGVAVPSLQGQ